MGTLLCRFSKVHEWHRKFKSTVLNLALNYEVSRKTNSIASFISVCSFQNRRLFGNDLSKELIYYPLLFVSQIIFTPIQSLSLRILNGLFSFLTFSQGSSYTTRAAKQFTVREVDFQFLLKKHVQQTATSQPPYNLTSAVILAR